MYTVEWICRRPRRILLTRTGLSAIPNVDETIVKVFENMFEPSLPLYSEIRRLAGSIVGVGTLQLVAAVHCGIARNALSAREFMTPCAGIIADTACRYGGVLRAPAL